MASSSPDGRSGDASGFFGLLVDAERERDVLPGAPFHAECASSSNDAGLESDAGLSLDGG